MLIPITPPPRTTTCGRPVDMLRSEEQRRAGGDCTVVADRVTHACDVHMGVLRFAPPT